MAAEIRDPRHLDLTRPRLPWVGLLCVNILLYLGYLVLDSLRRPGEDIDLLFHHIPSGFWQNFLSPDSPLTYAVLVVANVLTIFLWSRERWVQVAYDDSGKLRYAYFTDGGANGLSMYFGGAERLCERIKAGLESKPDDQSSPTGAGNL